ncbi:hypothetical protein Tco_0907301 [Tanacetum coccineum]|uniref:Uncharacterized protein n=1 Tax=Tanacetum coccineum TaxID=301880 RepID=A0ABQ5CIU9_9ASTR
MPKHIKQTEWKETKIYALTATADVPIMYLQQFWRMVRKLFHAAINRTNVDYAALFWWDFMNNVFQKKEVIQYPRFIKLIIANLVKKFPNIPKRIEEDYHTIKDDVLLETLRRKFEKSSPSITSCMEDDFHSQHNEHHEDDAPPKREKRVKRSKKSKRSKSVREDNVINEDEVIPEDKTHELIAEFHNIDKCVPTIFDHARMEATLRDTLKSKESYEYLKDYNSNHRIKKVVRIVTDQPSGLDFMDQILVMRANDKPDNFSEADFKYLNKKDIDDLYYVCQRKKVDNQKIKLMNSLIMFIRSCVIWERVHDFQLGIKSYQIKVNLTAPTLTFPGIEEHAPYSIVDEPDTCLIYLNNKDEKRVMYLVEIVKFCDATREKVLTGVKLRMFESKFLKKLPLLGDFDQGIMKAHEREISMHLSH